MFEAVHKVQMGNTVLTAICESVCKLPQDVTRIFIADRDDENTNKKLGTKDKNYKSWGNHTYSFLIPIPSNRTNTPDISIEHLFTDAEIITEVPCDDGIARRLYMGNEFDSHFTCGKAEIIMLILKIHYLITSSIILPPRRKLFWNSRHSAIT